MRKAVGLCMVLLAAVLAAIAPGNASAPVVPPQPVPVGWGDNQYGELALPSSVDATSKPSSLGAPNGLRDVVELQAGSLHALALTSDGSVWSWGFNRNGQVGDGTRGDWPCECRRSPVRVGGLPRIVSIAAGFNTSLAIAADGRAWMWGRVAATDRLVPVRVLGLPPVIAIAAGEGHQLALAYDGSVWSWGNNLNGQLGRATADWSDWTPRRVIVPHASQISAGVAHSLVLTSSGSVFAFGGNGSGQLGLGTLESSHQAPARIEGLRDVAAIAAGGFFSMALLPEGGVATWGSDGSGQLGDGALPSNPCGCRSTPRIVGGLPPVVQIAGGMSHTVVVAEGDRVITWGSGLRGTFGDGSSLSASTPCYCSPNPVETHATGARAIAAGWSFTIAIVLDEEAPEPSIAAEEDQVIVAPPTGTTRLGGVADDAYTGVSRVIVTFDSGSHRQTDEASVECDDAAQQHCTWAALLPSWPGRYYVHVRARDLAGNIGEAFGWIVLVTGPAPPTIPTRNPVPTVDPTASVSIPPLPSPSTPLPTPLPSPSSTEEPSPTPVPSYSMSPVPSPTGTPTPSPSASPY